MVEGLVECSKPLLPRGIPNLQDHMLPIDVDMLLRELKADRCIRADGKLILNVPGNDVGFANPTLACV